MGKEASPEAAYCTTCGAQLPEEASFCSECGRSAVKTVKLRAEPKAPRAEMSTQSSADPLIGATVADRYVIESMIGRGGMGVVYKVQHAKIGKIMALKLLTGALARNRETVQRFKREAMMASKLSHPNTVQVFDYGSVGGLTYLAMEYLSGYDLAELIERQGPQKYPQMAKIILQVCGALKEAHGYGMVHRDIKPENIFLTRTPTGEEMVKVLDFGLAKLRETPELGAITTTGNIVGTPFYMSPEQVRGEDVDPRGDIYSLSALLYTCMTGTYVFDAPTPLGVLTAQLHQEPQPPHERAPKMDIPHEVSALILKGLQKEPADRYQTVDEFKTALLSLLHGQSEPSLQLESGAFRKPQEEETATRDEVERYERQLKRREHFAQIGAALLAVGAILFGVHFFHQATKPKAFDGREVEPNHDVATATKMPFGAAVKGQLGRRISTERGDQDNYLVEIPENEGRPRTPVHLRLSALPNMGLCVFVFLRGSEEPQQQLCSGTHGRGVDIPRLELRPGSYLFAIRQDLNMYSEGSAVLIHENVSDDYVFSIDMSAAPPDWEVEPNDDEGSADQISLGEADTMRGSLNTMKDRDIVCATGSGTGRFVVTDAESGSRPAHAALRVTPVGGPSHKIPVRVHSGRPNIETTERDQPSPWTGPLVDLEETPCVTLDLVPNPWAQRPHPVTPPASDHEWRVAIEAAPENGSPTP